MMKCDKRYRQSFVGAQLIGAPPIYRPGKGIAGPLADKSALGAIMYFQKYMWIIKAAKAAYMLVS